MNFNDTRILIIAYSVSNIAGLLLLWAAIKRPKLARLFSVLLFAWASWINYTTCHQHPQIYLDYAQYAIGFYKDFINGWFKNHVTLMVTCISIGQALVAIGMALKGIWVKIACTGAVLFLLAIAPLGIAAGFPFSITVSAAAFFIIFKDDKNYLWKF
ncbi:MAG: hypothetical protein ACXVA2_12205 [Mucilaginibacter sp.]